jgi:hypothetical protein
MEAINFGSLNFHLSNTINKNRKLYAHILTQRQRNKQIYVCTRIETRARKLIETLSTRANSCSRHTTICLFSVKQASSNQHTLRLKNMHRHHE